MRKITSSHDKNRRSKRNKVLIGMILIILMFISVLGYAFLGTDKTDTTIIKYNGYRFVNMNGLWFTIVGNLDVVFLYNPNEVEKIGSWVNYVNTYYGKPLYISSSNDNAYSEVYNNLNQVVQRVQLACLEGKECEREDLPVKSCENNFIIIKEHNIASISQNQSCVFIQGPDEDLVKITDEFLFKILGIEP